MALFFVLVGGLYKVAADRKYPWYLSPLVVVILLAAAVAGIWLALPGLYNTLMGGVDFLNRQRLRSIGDPGDRTAILPRGTVLLGYTMDILLDGRPAGGPGAARLYRRQADG